MKRPLEGFITLNAADEIYGVGAGAMRGEGMAKANIPARVVKRELVALVATARRISATLALEGNFLLANELHLAAERAEAQGLGRGK